MGNQVDYQDLWQTDGIVRGRRFAAVPITYVPQLEQSASIVRSRVVNGGAAVWVSGQFVQDTSVPGSAVVVHDFGDATKQVLSTDDQGNTVIGGNLTLGASQSISAGSVDFGTGSELASSDWVDLAVTSDWAAPLPAVQVVALRTPSAASLAVVWGSTPVATNFLVLAVTYALGTTIATPTGWSKVKGANTASFSTYLFRRRATVGVLDHPTITPSAACAIDLVYAEYQGLSNAAVATVDITEAPVSLSNTIAPMLTADDPTTQPNELWIAAIGTNAGGVQSAPTHGFAIAGQVGTSDSVALLHFAATAKGVPQVGVTFTVASDAVVILFTVKAEPGSGVPTPPTGKVRYYSRLNAGISALYYKDDAGTEHGPLT